MSKPVRTPAATAPDDRALNTLVEEIAVKLQAGEDIDLDDYLERAPEHAAALRELFPAIELMAEIGLSLDGSGSQPSPPDRSLTAAPRVLGDFRLIHEIGRGGMGVVYEAEQMSLRRRVALKVLPFAATLDARQLQRFQLEAQAAACLHHTNIVPVHAVGADRGVHYYAMQFIKGQSLDRLIKDLRILEGLDSADSAGMILGDVTTSTLAARLLAGRTGPTTPVPDPNATTRTSFASPGEAVAGAPSRASATTDGSAWAGPPRGAARSEGAPAVARALTEPSSTPARPTPRGLAGQRSSLLTRGSSTRSRSYINTAARLALQAAEALDHAHTRGILHRDIKPGNLLLDTNGQLWITDFGLAQIQGDHRLTLSGDVLGTLRYMSPEQAGGSGVIIDGRTDVYSLGITLYELLALRAAFEGSSRADTLNRILNDEPQPLRTLNPAVPRDLETIVQKAIAKDPSERYATARALADDLQRFLLDQPIIARRPNVAERVVKWTRRHSAIVLTAAVGLFLLAVGLAVSTFMILNERNEVRRQREEARKAVDTMYTRVAQEWLDHQPKLLPLQREFLTEALRYYRQLARQQGTDPKIRRQSALAYYRVAKIQWKLGEIAQAEASYRKAIDILTGLVNRLPDDVESTKLLARNHAELVSILLPGGRRQQALSSARRALELWERVLTSNPNDLSDRAGYAYALGLVGALMEDGAGTLEEAERDLRRAVEIQEAIAAQKPAESDAKTDLAATIQHLAQVRKDRGDLKTARGLAERAVELQQAALKAGNNSCAHCRLSLSGHMRLLSDILFGLEEHAAALEVVERAIDVNQQLIADFPKEPRHRSGLADCHAYRGLAMQSLGKFAEAEHAYREAIQILESQPATEGDKSRFQIDLGRYYAGLGWQLKWQNRLPESEKAYRKALGLFDLAAQARREDNQVAANYADALSDFGLILVRSGRLEEAEAVWHKSVAILEGLIKREPQIPDHGWNLAKTLDQLGHMMEHTRQPEQAVREFRRGAELCQTLVPRQAPDFFRSGLQVELRFDLARLLESTGQYDEAVVQYRQALALAENSVKQYPRNDPTVRMLQDIRNDLSWFLVTKLDPAHHDPTQAVSLAQAAVTARPKEGAFWGTLGLAHYRAGDFDAAIEALNKSMDLHHGGDANDWVILAMACWQKGDRDQARSWFDKADKRLKEHPTNDADLRRLHAESAALLGAAPTSLETKTEETQH